MTKKIGPKDGKVFNVFLRHEHFSTHIIGRTFWGILMAVDCRRFVDDYILLMEDIPNSHLICMKPCKIMGYMCHINWLAGFFPSTVLTKEDVSSCRLPGFIMSTARRSWQSETSLTSFAVSLGRKKWEGAARFERLEMMWKWLKLWMMFLFGFLRYPVLLHYCQEWDFRQNPNATYIWKQIPIIYSIPYYPTCACSLIVGCFVGWKSIWMALDVSEYQTCKFSWIWISWVYSPSQQ